MIIVGKYVFITLIIIFNNSLCLLVTNFNVEKCLAYFVSYNIPYIITSLTIHQFILKICTIHIRLNSLNEILTKIVLNPKGTSLLLLKLKKIRKIHLDLWHASRLVNETYSIQLFFIVYNCFIITINVLRAVVKHEEISLLITNAFWTILFLSEIILILFVCRSTTIMV